MHSCLVCGGSCELAIDFGPMPVANRFLKPSEVAGEVRYPLSVVVCVACHMVQLEQPVPPSELFHDDYAFFSSTSTRMKAHFGELANGIVAALQSRERPFVVEIGSNDGVLLRHVASAGMKHLGIEPSENVAAVARGQGVSTLCAFFGEEVAEAVRREHGTADVIVGANVMCHLPAINDVAAGIARLLAPEGVLIFEDPYLGDILAKVAFDQVYDEHVFYFSVRSVSALFERHGLEVVDVQPQAVHGGSMRYTVAHRGAREVSPAVMAARASEEEWLPRNGAAFADFRDRVAAKRDALRALLSTLRAGGKRVVGYAATAKSSTTINYCGLTTELVEFIADTTPMKHGCVSPGAHLPVRPYEEFSRSHPDYALLFAWNHAAEIYAKERGFLEGGGQFITYVPEVGVVGRSTVEP